MATQGFTGVSMDQGKVEEVLRAAGVTDFQRIERAAKEHHVRGQIDGEAFFVKLLLNNNGTCTIGRTAGIADVLFTKVAQLIVNGCRYGEARRLETSIAQFNEENFVAMQAHLAELGSAIVEEPKGVNYRIVRVTGPLGDIATFKHFDNGTLQLQGRHGQVASWTLDFLRTVLPLDDVLEQQRKVYQIELTVDETKRELERRIPNAHDRLLDEVRMQLSSALALTKVNIEVEDYAFIAFPALKSLEGLCFHLLRDEAHLAPGDGIQLGQEYFEKAVVPGAKFRMRQVHAGGVAESLQTFLVACYTKWQEQRHRLFHMNGDVETTRILDNRADAVAIVDEVLSLVDSGFATYLKTKP